MKKFQKYLSVCAVAVMLAPLASCDDDDTVDPYDINYCYIYQPNSNFTKLEYKANGEFLIDVDDPLALKPVRLTKPAPRNINVEMAIDPTLVDEFNKSAEAGKKTYVFLEGASIVNPMLTIPAGEYTSHDPVTVTFGDKKAFQTENTDFVLPIVIRNADGMTISKSSRIFLTFTSTYRANMVNPTIESTINIDTDLENWQSAYTTSTINDILATSWNADDAITVKATVDNSLIDAYNSENNTDYKPLQVSLTPENINIAVGSNKANLGLTLGDYTGIANDEKYLIPVKFSITSGVGAELSSDVAYIKIVKLPLYIINRGSTQPSGCTLIPYEESWTGTINGDASFTENVLATPDDIGQYSWTTTNSQIVIDLASAKTVNVIEHRFWEWYYALNNIKDVQTSIDGNNWTDWGDANIGTYGVCYLEFSKPAKFRYIRWKAGDYSFSDEYGCFYTGLKFYTK